MNAITSPPRTVADAAAAETSSGIVAPAGRRRRQRRYGSWMPGPFVSALIGAAEGVAELLLLYIVSSSVRALVGLG